MCLQESDSHVSGRTPTDALSCRHPHSAIAPKWRRLVAAVVALAIALPEVATGEEPVAATDEISISADFGFATRARGPDSLPGIVLLRRKL